MFYMDARRYPYLCGHATIGAVATLVETGLLEAVDGDTVITVDTPSGPLEAHTRIRKGRVDSVAIDMVPSFVFETDREIEVNPIWCHPHSFGLCGWFFCHGVGPFHRY